MAAAAAVMGGLDTLVNSAGVFQFRALEDIATAEWDHILDVNLRGTFLVMREAMPHLKASGRGRVVNISSDAGKTGFALLGAYCASKFAVVGLTQAIAVEVAAQGVRVNAVCPGTVAETGMGRVVIEQKIELGFGRSAEEVVRRGAELFPLRRVGTVADVVDAIMFLISESSSWITGEFDQHRRRLAGGIAGKRIQRGGMGRIAVARANHRVFRKAGWIRPCFIILRSINFNIEIDKRYREQFH